MPFQRPAYLEALDAAELVKETTKVRQLKDCAPCYSRGTCTSAHGSRVRPAVAGGLGGQAIGSPPQWALLGGQLQPLTGGQCGWSGSTAAGGVQKLKNPKNQNPNKTMINPAHSACIGRQALEDVPMQPVQSAHCSSVPGAAFSPALCRAALCCRWRAGQPGSSRRPRPGWLHAQRPP
jgi:hypothetical protein